MDRWAKEQLAEEVNIQVCHYGIDGHGSGTSANFSQASEDPQEDSECQEQWKDLSEDITLKMWGIFDETGIFLSLCRHSFVLLVTDMIKSGEL